MAVSSHPIDDKQAQTESANGWEYVYRGIATGTYHGGVAVFPRVPCEQTLTVVPIKPTP